MSSEMSSIPPAATAIIKAASGETESSKPKLGGLNTINKVIQAANRYVRRVAMRGGNTHQSRHLIVAAKQHLNEKSDMAAMAAARKAIILAKAELSKHSEKSLLREGVELVTATDITMDKHRKIPEVKDSLAEVKDSLAEVKDSLAVV